MKRRQPTCQMKVPCALKLLAYGCALKQCMQIAVDPVVSYQHAIAVVCDADRHGGWQVAELTSPGENSASDQLLPARVPRSIMPYSGNDSR